ncbi:MAG: hypothetical protein H7210_03985 [Pyrinomonadaceae bacterium]|nr:hypothetical protein [Phycisphaerales bacterium]
MLSSSSYLSARWVGLNGFAVAVCVCIAVFAGWGHEPPSSSLAGVATVAVMLINAGLIAGAYLLAALGYGRLAVWVLIRRQISDIGAHWVQCALGLALMLWFSHLFGMLGLLSNGSGRWVGWAIVVGGVALLAWQVARGSLKPETWSIWPVWAMLAAPGIALVLVAASSPPGALWTGAQSEGGAYDVLSYHLQLPKEWALSRADGGVGRLWPVEHNVYSYLPGYMEGAYLHLAAMTGGGAEGGHGGNFVNGSGMGLMACQFLHAGMGIVGALFIGRLVTCSATWTGSRARSSSMTSLSGGTHGTLVQRGSSDVSAVVAFASVVSVPWVMVVGSLAYNELAVLAMGAGAAMIALDGGLSARTRGVLVGFLAGIACSAKMTSVFFVVPMAGLLLLFARRCGWREWGAMTAAGIAGGMAGMLPWLLRNYLACGNPVFPFARRVFGHSHWTDEQFNRFSLAHSSSGHGAMDHLVLLFSGDRGLLHEQWSILFPLGFAGLLLAAWWRSTRRIAALLILSLLIQLLAWVMFTHEQSRFLLPSIVPLCLGIGLGAKGLLQWVSGERDDPGTNRMRMFGSAVLALIPLSMATWGAQIFLSQRGGNPNLLLVAGVEALTGRAYAQELAQLTDSQRAEQLRDVATPGMYVNYGFESGEAVYLLGNAAPLYFFPPDGQLGLWYNTTWDASPLGIAVRSHPENPGAWTAEVTRAMQRRYDVAGRPLMNVHVLVDYSEISRLYPADTRKQVWFDPMLTQGLIRRWLATEGTLVRSWPAGEGRGVYMYKLNRKPGEMP